MVDGTDGGIYVWGGYSLLLVASAMKRLEEIRARAGKATEGPYSVELPESDDPETIATCASVQSKKCVLVGVMVKEDAEFYAHSRADIEYLLTLAFAGARLAAAMNGHCDTHPSTCQGEDCAALAAWHQAAKGE